MSLGVPTITYIRPEFVTDELINSGFVLSSLNTLERDLLRLLNNPEILAEKGGLQNRQLVPYTTTTNWQRS